MESNIKQLRERERITQQALGDALGLSQQIISRMELDRSKIQVDVLIKLAAYFHVTTDYVLGYEGEEQAGEPVSGTISSAVSAARGADTEFMPEIERLEQLNKSDRMMIWQLLAKLKRYI